MKHIIGLLILAFLVVTEFVTYRMGPRCTCSTENTSKDVCPSYRSANWKSFRTDNPGAQLNHQPFFAIESGDGGLWKLSADGSTVKLGDSTYVGEFANQSNNRSIAGNHEPNRTLALRHHARHLLLRPLD